MGDELELGATDPLTDRKLKSNRSRLGLPTLSVHYYTSDIK